MAAVGKSCVPQRSNVPYAEYEGLFGTPCKCLSFTGLKKCMEFIDGVKLPITCAIKAVQHGCVVLRISTAKLGCLVRMKAVLISWRTFLPQCPLFDSV